MTAVTEPQPGAILPGRDNFSFGVSVFLRLLAVIHVIAFVSFWTQWRGLVGPHGIEPAARYFAAAHQQLGAAAYFQLPSLCWIFGPEGFLTVLCAAGVTLGVLLFAGVAPALCLALLWAAYLTVCSAGQVFFNFQWDALLLEATLIGAFVAPWSLLPLWRRQTPPAIARWLFAWLIFRLMFLGGLVKLTSGDPSWRDFTALTYHFETQPLPTPLAWYAHHLPLWWHRMECGAMFAIELAVPFLLFAPRVLRHTAALLLAGLMAAVALTGNYTFFNLLAIALCLACLDDAFWRAIFRRGGSRNPPLGEGLNSSARVRHPVVLSFATFSFGLTGFQAVAVVFPQVTRMPGFESVERWVAPTRSFNNYGLFAVMTRPRYELVFEGSADGSEWREYEFPHKPGDVRRRPTWVAPHQPRLDWQLWFAALGSADQSPWVLSLVEHLLRGTPEVLALVERNPFPNAPPRFVRIIRYEYHFTDAATRARTGEWWRRSSGELYLGPAALR